MKTITQIKKYARQQGFKSQNVFAKVAAKKREQRKELRESNKTVKFSDNQEKIMSAVTPVQIKNLTLKFARDYSRIQKSSHARYEFGTKYSWGIVEYAKSAGCRDLHYNNVSVKLIGKTLTLETYFRGKEQKEVFKVWFDFRTKIVSDACLFGKSQVAVYRTSDLCVMRNFKTGERVGFAVKNIDGTWSHGTTLRDAIDEKLRQEKIAREKRIATRKHHLVSILCKNWTVTRDDSHYAGNCKIGTENFLKEQGIENVRFVNSTTLKELAKKNERAKRVYDYAIDLIANS